MINAEIEFINNDSMVNLKRKKHVQLFSYQHVYARTKILEELFIMILNLLLFFVVYCLINIKS